MSIWSMNLLADRQLAGDKEGFDEPTAPEEGWRGGFQAWAGSP